ncbi:amino acid adenylation domain-containing protein [Clostridium sp. 'deep sea']|uniref:non-ribosomal peptide synthetase n=1 Tax=Clostridium sp. 'deep sea' TaxID=2779445 RepID=UPI001896696C|nr:non-ribosomal peptide synthetase [Clostridium sp. 'deep sea']QOR34871.1 amino acid adenylation domain-containing protein [Clostridium sp. 'deep sea']
MSNFLSDVILAKSHIKNSNENEFSPASIEFTINDVITNKIKAVVEKEKISTSVFLLTAFSILLGKYASEEKCVIENIIKKNNKYNYVNVTNDINRSSFLSVCVNINKQIKEAVNGFNESNYHHIGFCKEEVGHNSKFALCMSYTENGSQIESKIKFNESLISKIEVQKLISRYLNTLNLIVKKPDIAQCDIDILSAKEKKVLLKDFNNNKQKYQSDKTICELIEKQVINNPHSIAVEFHNNQLTYSQLNEKANLLASYLQQKGVKTNDIVGLLAERSLETVVAIVAILKVGAAYMPINPLYPSNRINYMIRDSKTKLVLAQNKFLNNLLIEQEIIDINDKNAYSTNSYKPNPLNSSNTAYVIYTSGSTGKPKGVEVSHKSLHNFLNSFYIRFNKNIGYSDKCLSLTNISFDVAVAEIFFPLCYGATLVLFENDLVLNINNIAQTIVNKKITFTYIPPTILQEVYNLIKDKDIALNKMLVGVESIKDYVLEQYLRLNANMQIINGYGPTETTICATMFNYLSHKPSGNNVSIGSPLLNTQIYILDKNQNPVPMGVAGELCIAGDNLAKGYLHKPELTAEKFINNPFIEGTKMYKTGDLARWHYNGKIEFLGRIDYQVKIRGFRVEPGEIESQLLKIEAIKQAVVLAKKNAEGIKYLCAYYIANKAITVTALRENLALSLPNYMIPSYFKQLAELPLTLNGKINRKALPEPTGDIQTGQEYVSATNLTEQKLTEIWSKVLVITKIGINDNFFVLGGDSLKAIKIIAAIQEQLKVSITVSSMFKHASIKKLALHIANCQKSEYFTIEQVAKQELYEVSSAQKRMYAASKTANNTNYNLPLVKILEGNVQKQKIELCFKQLINKHEVLRTSFEIVNNNIMQRIHDQVAFNMQYAEINSNSSQQVHNEVKKFVRPFNLAQAPLLRLKLLKLKQNKFALMIDMHHIIADGTSVAILMEQFSKLYNGENLTTARVQYKDYTAWQHKVTNSDLLKKSEEYWSNIFNNEVPVLNLPTDYKRPNVQSFEGDTVSFKINKSLTRKLKNICKASGATLYMLLMAAYNVLLAKYTAQEDIVIGVAAAGRQHSDLQQMIGMFVNTLALRNYPHGHKKFSEFLNEVKQNALKAYENQNYQFEMLVEKLNMQREQSRAALIETIFVLQNTDNKELELPDVKVTNYHFKDHVSKFDLSLEAYEQHEVIEFNFEYCTKLFKRTTITRLISHFKNILKVIAKDCSIELSQIEMLSDSEKTQILKDFNNTKTQYPNNKTLCELFEQQTQLTPNKIAVVHNHKKVTYKELNERANKLAFRLIKHGVLPNNIVAIMADRSLEMIVATLAILKSGAAYLPIDTDYPAERVAYMLSDCEVNVLLTEQKYLNQQSFKGTVINLNNEKSYSQSSCNPQQTTTADSLAYIIYTSGTTGKPKGVAVKQKNVVRLVKNTNYIRFKPEDKILQTGSITFDASTFEIWGALLNGLSLYLTSKDVILSAEKLGEYLLSNSINILWLTSPLFNKICEEKPNIFTGLSYLLVGGDVVSPKNVALVKQYAPLLTVINGYGPTENTTFSTCYVIKDNFNQYKTLPIGKPIANSTAYIFDKHNKLVPIGVYGQLCVGGDGLAAGYLNKPQLTSQKFVNNPSLKGQLMYRTGDLARWLPDGNIEFLGRVDHQVKIRGFRIEPAEIENSLLKLAGIKEALVIDRGEKSNKYLCAYIVTDTKYSPKKLRQELKQDLPNYMIPSYFINLAEMPLNQNGKINRELFPHPTADMKTGIEYVKANTELEKKLVKIWCEILGVNKIGINDDFFTLGGHSLKAINVAALIEKELLVTITVSDIFKNPNIKQLAEYLNKSVKSEYIALEPVQVQDYYPVSSAQRRMYALNQFSTDNINYNVTTVKILTGKLNKNQVEFCFKQLVTRHEAFRTSFELINNQISQKIHSEINFKIEYTEQNLNSQDLIKAEIFNFVKPFKLNEAPLLRVKLIKVAEEKHILMFDMHHIISDGSSMDIIMNEFTSLYKGESLEELAFQYKDYCAWEQKKLSSPAMKKHEQYWLNQFTEVPVLNMPTDYNRPSYQSFKGDTIGFNISKELSKSLYQVCQQNGVTIFMALLAAYNILLAKYSGQEDIVVGTPIAGRQHADLTKILGMFVNTLAIRNYPNNNKSYSEFLQEVKQNCLKAYENQDYPFDKLVEKLDLNRDLSRNPLFDTMFILQNTENKELEIADNKLKPFPFERGKAKFDITLEARELNNSIYFNLEYATKVFSKQTIKKLINHYQNILIAVANNPHIKLAELEMLSAKEKQQLLIEFNDTKTTYPKKQTICECFEALVEKVPNNCAVVFEGKKLSYRELNEKANQLARALRAEHIKPDSVVALLADRSLTMMIAIMAILKAGAAYMPISPEYPKDRVNYMLKDSKATVLLTQNHLINNISFNGTVLDLNSSKIYEADSSNLPLVNTASDLAYIIYTSGSTGKPKGVMIEHGNVINLVTALNKNIYSKYHNYLNISLIAPYVFDASVKQIFASLLQGHCLHIIPEECRYMGADLVEYYINNAIDVSDGTPSHFKLILEDNTENIKNIPVKHFIIGGEALPVQVVKDFLAFFKANKPNITNIYGPTECCVDTTAFLVDYQQLSRMNSIPIGHPLANYQVYVLNKTHKLQPVGVAGELCIAGEGLARGYLNSAELTDQKFVNNPFAVGEKMYKTGDLVKWLPSGNLEFLGRIDYQVKIRGYRIEIGEIDSLIKAYETVKDSVVLARDQNDEKILVAYVVAKNEQQYSEKKLKEYLKNKLPKYMIPTAFVKLDFMPLNANGKVDRFALPEPNLQRDADELYVAPRNQAENEMANKWNEILGVKKIGIDDDFFDLGGDSFKAIKLVRSVSEGLGVMDLFKNSTIRELINYLSQDNSGERGMLIEFTKAIAAKDQEVSLICFPFGGGSAISYQPLANALPPNYSLYAVELPGHDFSRPNEELMSIKDSANRCLQEIKEKVTGPIVLYGHCLGATMAVYLAYELEKAGRQVQGVFVGAMFPAPRITNMFFKIWDKIFPSLLTDKGNKDLLRTIGGLTSDISPAESDFIIRNLKHDSKECIDWYSEVYNTKNKPKFKAPITCVIGDGDRMTEFYQERYHEWEFFSDYVDLKTVENGGHFFFKSQATELANIIENKVNLWQSCDTNVQDQVAATNEKVVNMKKHKRVVPSMQLFLTVAIVQIISEVGSIIATFGAGLWILQQTGTLSAFATMLLFRIIPTIIIMPFAGTIVDRFNKRLILILGDIIAALSSISILILLYNNGLETWHIYVFTVLSSIATCFRQPAYLAAVTQITPKMYLAQANSVAQFSGAIGNIVGPIFSGLLMITIGFKGLVIIDLVSFIVAIAVLCLLRFPNTMFTRSEEPILKELLGGWNFIIKRKSMVAMVVFFLLVNFVFGIFDVILIPLVSSYASETTLGFVRSFMGVGILVGSIIMLATGGIRKRAKGMVGFVVPLAISVCIAGLRPNPVFAAIAFFGVFFSTAIVDVHWRSLIQVKVGLELQGRVFAVNRMLVSILTPISYLTANMLTNKLKPLLQTNFFNSSVVNFIVGEGAGKDMRLVLIIAGITLLVWAVLGLNYKPLSNMDDILADASQGQIIVKDKDKLQKLIDKKQSEKRVV